MASTEKVLAIDPGTSNLGWALMTGEEIIDCGLDTIWRDQPDVFQSLAIATVSWFTEKEHIFAEADVVLIEQQYQGKSMLQVFKPYIVMTTLFACCELRFPGKIKTISPSAVKAFFGVKGGYEERKAQVVKLAGLGNIEGRMHDIADCVLMVQYYRARNAAKAEHAKLQAAREAKRAEVRAKLLEKVPIKSRDKSPQRSLQCTVCQELVTKLCKGACKRCYQRAYREKHKR